MLVTPTPSILISPVTAIAVAFPSPFPMNRLVGAKSLINSPFHSLFIQIEISDSPVGEQSRHQIISPSVGFSMASRSILLIRGNKKPLVVLSISRAALTSILPELAPNFCTICAEMVVVNKKKRGAKTNLIEIENKFFIMLYLLAISQLHTNICR